MKEHAGTSAVNGPRFINEVITAVLGGGDRREISQLLMRELPHITHYAFDTNGLGFRYEWATGPTAEKMIEAVFDAVEKSIVERVSEEVGKQMKDALAGDAFEEDGAEPLE